MRETTTVDQWSLGNTVSTGHRESNGVQGNSMRDHGGRCFALTVAIAVCYLVVPEGREAEPRSRVCRLPPAISFAAVYPSSVAIDLHRADALDKVPPLTVPIKPESQ